jgi:ankyrin repeat protein
VQSDALTLISRLVALGGLLVAGAVRADSALLEAAKIGDSSSALARIAAGADVNVPDSTGTTVLHWAVYNNAVELVEALLNAGADPNAANRYGSTVMSEAAVAGDVSVIQALLDAGADVESANAEGQTALMIVARTANTAAAEALIAAGADVNAREAWKGQSALMWAAARGRSDMVRLLAAHGADVNARSAVNDWPRQTTVFPRAKYLPSGGLTPLLFAAREACAACIEALVDAGADQNLPDPDEVTPLLMALLNARFDAAAALLDAGANVNKWDWWGQTPLYAAIDYNTLPTGGRFDRPSADETTAIEIIQRLLEAGANPNAQLKLLPPYRNVLDDRGADPLITIGTTPLIRAAKGADSDAVRLLLEHGALPDLPQDEGVTALMAVAGLQWLAINTRGRYVTEPEAIATAELLIGGGAEINQKDNRGQTALHGAAFRGWNKLVEFLVENGADLNATDNDGATPLDAALGRMRASARGGASEVHEDTAALLASLVEGTQ